MGIEIDRFVQNIDDELKCTICCGVLENAVQITQCEHTFCSDCIRQWIQRHPSCPIDRRELTPTDIVPASRLLNSFLSRLNIKCDFSELGCHSVVTLESLSAHTSDCNFNPEKPFACEKGCGVLLTNRQKDSHNCVLEDILVTIENQNERISKLEKLLSNNTSTIMQRLDAVENKIKLIENKYLALENKCENLMLASINFQNSKDSDVINTSNDIIAKQENASHVETAVNIVKAVEKSRIFKTITVEIDHKLKTIELCANIYEPIINIKTRISGIENIAVQSQCLFYDELLLSDHKCINDYSIISPHFTLVKRPIKVDLIIFSDNLSLLVEPNEMVGNVKLKLRKLRGVDVSLSYFGQILDDSRTLYSYRIRDRAKIKVTYIDSNGERAKSLSKLNL